jgi:hypothetical protein
MTMLTTRGFGHIPWYRRMLADEGLVSLGLPVETTPGELRRFQAAFPEAFISQESTGIRIH